MLICQYQTSIHRTKQRLQTIPLCVHSAPPLSHTVPSFIHRNITYTQSYFQPNHPLSVTNTTYPQLHWKEKNKATTAFSLHSHLHFAWATTALSLPSHLHVAWATTALSLPSHLHVAWATTVLCLHSHLHLAYFSLWSTIRGRKGTLREAHYGQVWPVQNHFSWAQLSSKWWGRNADGHRQNRGKLAKTSQCMSVWRNPNNSCVSSNIFSDSWPKSLWNSSLQLQYNFIFCVEKFALSGNIFHNLGYRIIITIGILLLKLCWTVLTL